MTTRRGVVGGPAALVRASLWWSAKLLPLVAAGALAALTAGVPADAGLRRLAAMLASAVCVAAGAHVVNDLSDRAADRLAGKPNLLADAPAWVPMLLLVGAVAGGLAPWWFVALDPGAAVALAALVVLSVAYSAPPIRLKGRGGWGVLADAVVVHTLPTVFAFLEVGAAGTRHGRWWTAFVLATVWATAFGVRSIIVHQVLDAEGDRSAGVSTFVVRRGVPRAVRIGRDAFGVEAAALAGLFVVSTIAGWGIGLFFAAHVGLWVYHRRFERPEIDTVPTTPGAWLPIAEFYEVWPAVAFAVALANRDAAWWWLVAAIAVLFVGAVAKQVWDEAGLVADLAVDAAHVLATWARAAYHVVLDIVVKKFVYYRLLVPTGHWLVKAAKWCVASSKVVWWAIYRVFWFANRAHWRVRHAVFDPVVAFVRRQWRRLRRRLGATPRHP